jgi:hypothetical protein
MADSLKHTAKKGFMKSRWGREKNFSKIIKDSPQKYEAQRAPSGLQQPHPTGAFFTGRLFQSGQTAGANHPLIIFGNTLAAK